MPAPLDYHRQQRRRWRPGPILFLTALMFTPLILAAVRLLYFPQTHGDVRMGLVMLFVSVIALGIVLWALLAAPRR